MVKWWIELSHPTVGGPFRSKLYRNVRILIIIFWLSIWTNYRYFFKKFYNEHIMLIIVATFIYKTTISSIICYNLQSTIWQWTKKINRQKRIWWRYMFSIVWFLFKINIGVQNKILYVSNFQIWTRLARRIERKQIIFSII